MKINSCVVFKADIDVAAQKIPEMFEEWLESTYELSEKGAEIQSVTQSCTVDTVVITVWFSL